MPELEVEVGGTKVNMGGEIERCDHRTHINLFNRTSGCCSVGSDFGAVADADAPHAGLLVNLVRSFVHFTSLHLPGRFSTFGLLLVLVVHWYWLATQQPSSSSSSSSSSRS
ncbi:hypothetical protein M0804_014311 [Polistes exclamans]|nr:hypothetical protein M0804_014315 [Polistes exclamans]KAI4475437.1 hypothetical protein M0804_014311 [Polistes exclamans]